jgi:hypothetical protein
VGTALRVLQGYGQSGLSFWPPAPARSFAHSATALPRCAPTCAIAAPTQENENETMHLRFSVRAAVCLGRKSGSLLNSGASA